MGQEESLTAAGELEPNKIEEFSSQTVFSAKQIIQLWSKYSSFASQRKHLSPEVFMKEMNISSRMVARVIFRVLIEDTSTGISFDEFVLGLNTFMPQASLEGKIQLCFRAFDESRSGAITKDQLRSIIDISLEDNPYLSLAEPRLQHLIADLFKTYDTSKSGNLCIDDFSRMVRKAPGIIECLNIDFSRIFE